MLYPKADPYVDPWGNTVSDNDVPAIKPKDIVVPGDGGKGIPPSDKVDPAT